MTGAPTYLPCLARDEGADILILARTDARQAVSLQEALWRAQAFADAGADILFIDALASVEELQSFCDIAKDIPKVNSTAAQSDVVYCDVCSVM